MSHREIKSKYGVPISTLSYWKNKYDTSNINTKAKFDNLILEITKDDWYDIRSDGSIWTCIPPSGPRGSKKYPWRKINRFNYQNYEVIKYKNCDLKVHRIIYQKFIGDLDPTLEINHIDGNKTNNIQSNLELISKKDNISHAINNGSIKTILNENIVKQIKTMYSNNIRIFNLVEQLNL